MNSEHDQQLEAEINRALKALPELTAPASLASRVMAAIDKRDTVPWYRRSWQSWPLAVRCCSLGVMLLLFCAACFAAWTFSGSGMSALALQKAGEWASGFEVVLNTLGAILNAFVLVGKKLGTGFIAACLIVAGLSYVMFVGLGTLYVRLAFVKR
jgi:hypothetical protein